MLLEIRTYRLHPGTRAEFHAVVVDQCLPLLGEYGIDVVRSGPSEADDEGAECYVLMRAFPSAEERLRQEDEFYGSRVWADGPRDAILSRIESYHTVVLTISDDGNRTAIAGDPVAFLRRATPSEAGQGG